jgi:hypothetical protein
MKDLSLLDYICQSVAAHNTSPKLQNKTIKQQIWTEQASYKEVKIHIIQNYEEFFLQEIT